MGTISIYMPKSYIGLEDFSTENKEQQNFLKQLNKEIQRIQREKYPIECEIAIIGCGIYRINEADNEGSEDMEEAVKKTMEATGYQPKWKRLQEPEDENPRHREPIPYEKGWYHKQLEEAGTDPESIKKIIPKAPEPGKAGNEIQKSYYQDRERRYQETLARHQKMFAELSSC
jgi:hypothetical protein